MLPKHEIDYWINVLLDFLSEIQGTDGSFDTMYLQPSYNPDKGWMHYAGNSPYETAFPLTVLSNVKSAKSEKITGNGIAYIKKNSLDTFLWTYAYPSKKALVPYDTDSTSLSSLVLEKNGYTIKNKLFLDDLIDEKNYYPFYIWPGKKSKNIRLITYLKLKWRNIRTRNSSNIINKVLELDDSEFTSTCINLLYLGKTKENERVWKTLVQKFQLKQIDFLYYIDCFHAIYHYSRLSAYGNHPELIDSEIDSYIEILHNQLSELSHSPRSVLFLSTILLSGNDLDKYQKNVDAITVDLKKQKYKMNSAFYSSNVKTDMQSQTNLPNTYFGSPAITCSLYIEFLNLCRRKYYGSYYGE